MIFTEASLNKEKVTNNLKPNPDKPEQKNKNYHENTKVRKHEKLNVFLFRAFVIIF